jgi:DNA replication protein DnaC
LVLRRAGTETLATFDFKMIPMVCEAQVMVLAAGDTWLEKGAVVVLFGPPGAGKLHLSATIGLALVANGRRVLFTRIRTCPAPADRMP